MDYYFIIYVCNFNNLRLRVKDQIITQSSHSAIPIFIQIILILKLLQFQDSNKKNSKIALFVN